MPPKPNKPTPERPKEKPEKKVGSDPEAARHFADGNDFGLPPNPQQARREHEAAERPIGPIPQGNRTSGVGTPQGGPGKGSAGDVGTDVIGVGGTGGLSQSPPDRITIGPASSTGSSDEFASGPHAKGENTLPPNAIGGGSGVHGDTMTHGTSAEINPESGAEREKLAPGPDRKAGPTPEEEDRE